MASSSSPTTALQLVRRGHTEASPFPVSRRADPAVRLGGSAHDTFQGKLSGRKLPSPAPLCPGHSLSRADHLATAEDKDRSTAPQPHTSPPPANASRVFALPRTWGAEPSSATLLHPPTERLRRGHGRTVTLPITLLSDLRSLDLSPLSASTCPSVLYRQRVCATSS